MSTKKIYELLPCPFCGGEGHMEHNSRAYMNHNSVRVAYVYCKNCNARSPKFNREKYSPHTIAEQKAAEAWNTRTRKE